VTPDELPPGQFVRLDFFPADVAGIDGLPSGDLKVVATDTHLVIAANGSTGPEIVFIGVLDDYQGFDKTIRGWRMTLETGEEVSITRANSCGCGSALRGFRLYSTLRRVVS
jgi:hypothetical protein